LSFDAKKYLGDKGLRNFDRLTKMLIVCGKLALQDADLKRAGSHLLSPDRIGVCSATAYGSLEAITEAVQVTELEDPRFLNPNRFPNTVINAAAGYVSIWEDLRAPNVTVVDGNCGSLDAVLSAETHLQNDRADAFLVGGGEALSEALYVAFRKLNVLAEGARVFAPGRPESQGMRLGEGAAYLCLEQADFARARGARVRAEIIGYGNAFDAPVSEARLVHVSSDALQRAIKMALLDADLTHSGSYRCGRERAVRRRGFRRCGAGRHQQHPKARGRGRAEADFWRDVWRGRCARERVCAFMVRRRAGRTCCAGACARSRAACAGHRGRILRQRFRSDSA
jgi:3-oxoacyl-(acyl-carrier-protein) synthase